MSAIGKFVPLFGNPVLDSLNLFAAWNQPTITYSFGYSDLDRNGVPDMQQGDWKAFHREILDGVEAFTPLRFIEVAEPGNINFLLREGGGGESGVPVRGTRNVDTVVGIDPDVEWSAEAVRLGTFSLTWLHELGHALGLKHTHDDDGGPKLPGVVNPEDRGTAGLNSDLYTVMGYVGGFLGEDNPFTAAVDPGVALRADLGSFAPIDIAALQRLYGVRAANTGDDVYRFSDDTDANRGYTTIWDTGGNDLIQYVGTSRAKIDLRAATLQVEVGGGGWVSTSETLTGGFTIANGVWIEGAMGGEGDDILIGNAASNYLLGSLGNDLLQGGAGDDALAGGTGNNVLDGGDGYDIALFAGGRRAANVAQDGGQTRVTSNGGTDTLTSIEEVRFADGRLVFDANDEAAQVVRLYQAALGRAPEQSGLGFWTTALSNGAALDQLAQGFLNAPEFVQRYGAGLSNEAFVTALYENILGRGPDAAGHAFWTNALNDGASRATVLSQLSESGENKTKTASLVSAGIWDADDQMVQLARLYDTAFGRNADLNGTVFWKDAMQVGSATLTSAAAAFTQSAEFLLKYGALDNAAFVTAIYQNALDRTPDADGLAFWVAGLDAGASRADFVVGISESPEHAALTLDIVGGGATQGILFA